MLRDSLTTAARGMAMGAADVVPGVSGGTMALVLGIYDRLIDGVRGLAGPGFLKPLLRLRLRTALQAIDWRFLLSLGIGILAAVLTLAPLLKWTLDHHAALLWSFFFGLILASIWSVSRQVHRWSALEVGALALGAVGAWILVGAIPLETPTDPWFLVVAGAAAACAMILPGISGSFVLLLLGKYYFVLTAVNERQIGPLLWVVIGIGIGLLSFTHVVGFLLQKAPATTLAALIGLMAGSLRKIWPWKITLQTRLDSHGNEVPLLQKNVLPGFDTSLVACLVLFAIGGLLVVLIESRRREDASD